jgi:hypothetical protein
MVEQKGFKKAVQGDNVLAARWTLHGGHHARVGEVSETVQIPPTPPGETGEYYFREAARVVDKSKQRTWR